MQLTSRLYELFLAQYIYIYIYIYVNLVDRKVLLKRAISCLEGIVDEIAERVVCNDNSPCEEVASLSMMMVIMYPLSIQGLYTRHTEWSCFKH